MAKWVKGQSGNPAGRPKGSRDKLTEAVFSEFAAHWKEHGIEAIGKVFETRPDLYVQAAIRLIPQNIQVEATDARRSAIEYDTSELIALAGEYKAEGVSAIEVDSTGAVEPDAA